MRKKAQEKKRAAPPSPASSCLSSQSSNNHLAGSNPSKENGEESFYDTGGPNMVDSTEIIIREEQYEQGYSMDDIWKDIDLSEENILQTVYDGHIEDGECNFSCPQMASTWEYPSDSLWVMDDEEESKMFLPTNDQFFSHYGQGKVFLTG